MTFAAGAMTVVRRTTRLASSSSAAGPGAAGFGALRPAAAARGRRRGRRACGRSDVAGVGAGSPPARRRRASSSDWRLKLASCVRRSFLFALARFGGFALGRFARLALAARLGFRLLAAAVLLLARARVDERPGARLALLFGERAQHDAGLRRRRRAVGARGAPLAARPERAGFGRDDARVGGAARAAAASPGSENAALDLLDDDRLAAPVRKTLAHGALLDGPLQVQSRLRGGCAQSLVAAVVRFTHAFFQ